MKTKLFTLLAQLNKAVLPSFSKKGLDMAEAKKWQLAIIGYRLWVTKRAQNPMEKKEEQ